MKVYVLTGYVPYTHIKYVLGVYENEMSAERAKLVQQDYLYCDMDIDEFFLEK